ncbi:hypothetical protein [Halobacillus alkaliphilus]|nr:hypothetical protein [Halobacillus alkaliphilus]
MHRFIFEAIIACWKPSGFLQAILMPVKLLRISAISFFVYVIILTFK